MYFSAGSGKEGAVRCGICPAFHHTQVYFLCYAVSFVSRSLVGGAGVFMMLPSF